MMNSKYVRDINNICTSKYTVYYSIDVYILPNY